MIIKIGNWLFHRRNYLFPVLYAGLFIPSPHFTENSVIPILLGLFVILTGIIVRCATIGLEYIIRGGSKRTIYAEKLVTGGIYSICRNPMYLGNLLILLGFGIFVNSVVFTFIFFPVSVFVYYSIIRAEEEYLFNKFGEEFIRYKHEVNALLPSLTGLRTSFSGHSFNWKKVILKEYNSLFLYFSGLLLILFYQKFIDIRFFTITLIIIVFFYLLIKVLKYNVLTNE